MPVAPVHRLFVMHFKVGITVPFVRITELTAVLLKGNNEEDLTLKSQGKPNQRKDAEQASTAHSKQGSHCFEKAVYVLRASLSGGG